jgi:ABC-type nitrate/sulfonate/bicarbonate transport system substrate-binding protein
MTPRQVKEFAEKNPDAVKAFVAANRQLSDEIAKDPGAAAPVLVNEIRRLSGQKVSDEIIRRALKRCRLTPDITQHDVHVFANLVEVAGYKSDITASLDGVLWRSTP